LVAGIAARRTIALDRLIFALGVREIGEQTSLLLTREFGSWEAFHAAGLQAAAGIPSAGWTALSLTPGISPRVLSILAAAEPPEADPWPEAPLDQKIALAFPGLAAPARRALAERAPD